jgi:nicotinamidase/pyrazinamidase
MHGMKALIIIDMLVRDMKGLSQGGRSHVGKLIDKQLLLIDAFHKKGDKIIIVGERKDGIPEKNKNPVMLTLWGDEDAKDPEENKVIPAILHAENDLYIAKKEYSAFYKTSLEKYCKKQHITDIYLCGINSGVCVYFTGADAAMRGILPILVSDATATKAGTTWHKKNCTSFKHILGPVMTTKEAIRSLK